MLTSRSIVLLLIIALVGCQPSSQSSDLKETEGPIRNIIFIGDDLSEWGLFELNEQLPQLLQERLDSFQLPYHVHYDPSLDKDSRSLADNIDQILDISPELLLIGMGSSDHRGGLRLDESRKNIQHIIDLSKSKYPMSSIVLLDFSDFHPEESQGDSLGTLIQDLAVINQTALISLPGKRNPFQEVSHKPQEFRSDELIWKGIRPLL